MVQEGADHLLGQFLFVDSTCVMIAIGPQTESAARAATVAIIGFDHTMFDSDGRLKQENDRSIARAD